MEKWLLDTDIGCDSDDCMALGYLLGRNDVRLMGITTVSGDSYKRALFADKVCKMTSYSIPIHVGNETALDGRILQPSIIRGIADEVLDYNTDTIAQNNDAVIFMKKTIEENPNEITLVAIGQFTNVALLFSAFPHIPKLLKSLVVMGGRYLSGPDFDTEKWGFTEWNIYCDPYAASIVFNADVPKVYACGVEITCTSCKKAEEVRNKISTVPWMEPIKKSLKYHDKPEHVVWFHDAVLVWAALNIDRLCWQQGRVSVNFENKQGVSTDFTPCKSGKHFVLNNVDIETFFNEYADTLGFKWEK